MSKNIDLRSLDFNNSGAWPTQVKLGACVLLVALIIGLGWYLFVSDKRATLETEEATEVQLREEFQGKQGRAANLEPLKQQLAQMEVMLQQMLRQLPSKNEMPDLIVDISQTALAAGISNELFQPGAESQLEFYAEKPIQLRMVGSYHQFGAFVSGVASLPRVVIMTMHDISLQPREGSDGTLVLSGTVKTYRYLDEEEESQDSNTAGGSK
ncbi:MAG: type 4a pilus biogenesis protein PilO [Pseudomonadota bacterium]